MTAKHKLEALTKEQEELMFQTRDEWINDFFSKKEINKKDFEEGITWLYQDLLKKSKPNIIYCDSWLSCLITIQLLKSKNSVGASVRASVGASVEDSVRASVGASVRASVGASVGASVRASVEDSVRASVGASVRASVEDSVRASVGASVRDYSNYTNSYANYGWVSFYDYFEKIGVLSNNNFTKYKKLIKSGAFQVYEYKNTVFAIQPPTIIRNEQGQLNSIETKAVEWADGTGFYYINGLEIKEDLFLKLKNKELSLEEFLKEDNEEVKSAIIGFIQQRDGEEGIYRFFEKYLQEINTYVDKKEAKYLEGTLNSMNVGVYTLFKGEINGEDVAYVRCYCPSTDRMFFLGVEPIHNNAKDAIASLYQVPVYLKDDITSISRQGEKFSTTFTEEVTNNLKLGIYTKEQLSECTSISGERYFKLMTYEY